MKSFRVFRMKYTGGAASSDLSLLPLREQDFPAYMAVYNACFRPMREALECSPTDFYYSESQLAEKRQDIFALWAGEKLVGSVAIYGGEIDDLVVNPAYQGRGYGRRLLAWAVARMQERGIDPITLSVVDWNVRARALYESFGFETFEILRIGSDPTEE